MHIYYKGSLWLGLGPVLIVCIRLGLALRLGLGPQRGLATDRNMASTSSVRQVQKVEKKSGKLILCKPGLG